MDLFIMVSRKKTTLFLDVNETTSIEEVKMMIQGILKVDPEEQRLYHGNTEVRNHETLADIGLERSKAGAHCPASFGLAIGTEELDIAPLSSPPDYQDVIKHQDATPETNCAM